jgi:hypothetical protein
MDAQQLCREISKLIAAIDRSWKEELGDPDARETERVLRSAEQLLRAFNQGTLPPDFESLQQLAGQPWLDSHSWARPYIERIDAALARPRNNP